GRTPCAPAERAMRLEIFWSCFQLGYLAQALKRQVMAERWLASLSSFARPERPGAAVPTWPVAVTKVQPESRVQTRSVGQRWKRTLSLSAFALSRVFRARLSAEASFTIRSTRSWRVRFRIISA